MHIQLKAVRYVRRAGVQITYHPGDWLEIGTDIGKQAALLWVAEGAAHMPQLPGGEGLKALSVAADEGADWGVVVRGGNFKDARKRLPTTRLQVVAGDKELPFASTLLWSPPAPLRAELLPIGFLRLERGWQLAVPLLSYERLASTVGTPEDRALTQKVVPDLRVLLYDTRLIFARRCTDIEHLMKVWASEPGDERLAFLRALFAVKPIICALPQKWVGDRG